MSELTDYKTVREIDQDDNFILVSDSQHIEAYLCSIDYQGDMLDYGCLFAHVHDGEIIEVYGVESNIPYLNYCLDKIY